MFRKIVTELAYSPALVEELAIYSRQLRREKTRRQIGLAFLLLSLGVQLLISLSPPESANANNPTAFIDGGFQNIDEYLSYYDHNTENIRDLLASLGISRTDIADATLGQVDSETNFYTWSKVSHGDKNDTIYPFQTEDKKIGTAYYQLAPAGDVFLNRRLVDPLSAYIGSSETVGKFALLRSTGNLLTEKTHQPSCQTDPLNIHQSGTEEDAKCPTFETTLSASNITTNDPADKYSASASDRILYALHIKNTSESSQPAPLRVQLWDLLEYAQILDKGGGEFDEKTKILTWPTPTLAPGESITRDFIVQILPSVPSTARGQHNLNSYDCLASVSFGNTLEVPIACPFAKTIERTIQSFPQLPAPTSLMYIATITLLAIYCYARNRQLLAELRRIQHNHSGSI